MPLCKYKYIPEANTSISQQQIQIQNWDIFPVEHNIIFKITNRERTNITITHLLSLMLVPPADWWRWFWCTLTRQRRTIKREISGSTGVWWGCNFKFDIFGTLTSCETKWPNYLRWWISKSAVMLSILNIVKSDMSWKVVVKLKSCVVRTSL